jgi:hypothetical protein
MKIPLTLVLLSVAFLPFQFKSAYAENTVIPKFEVGGVTTSTVSLIVPKTTSNEQLTALVRDFQKAKQENNFARLIPPTTPKGNRGPYFVVTVYVLDDPKLATADNLDRFTRADSKEPFAKKFANSVRAYYYFTALSNEEQGSLGYGDYQLKGKNYQKLF